MTSPKFNAIRKAALCQHDFIVLVLTPCDRMVDVMNYTLKKKLRDLSKSSSWLHGIYLFAYLMKNKLQKHISDENYIKKKFRVYTGKELNIERPITFNEKNNWRKLFDRKDIYTQMVDKYGLKKIVAQKVGGEYTFPLLGAWDSPEEIDFDKLPDQFVLKCNHAGGVIVCRERAEFNPKKAIKELKYGLKFDYYLASREWPYKNVPRKIIAEQYMGENLTDYKNYCFNGKLRYTFVWENQSRKDGRKPEAYFCGAYDCHWNKSEIEVEYPSCDKIIEKPQCYEKMVEVAEELSKSIPFVRVDCYIINNHVYVGEMTFFPWGGFMRFKDEKWDYMLGELESLPNATK